MTDDLDKLLADAASSAKAASGWAEALDDLAYLDPEEQREAAMAIRNCVCDLESLATEVVRLTRERDAAVKTVELLLSESKPQAVPCVDHPVLDMIARAITPAFRHLGPDCLGPAEEVTRESKCVEFRCTSTGRRYEIIVRPIPDEEDRP